MNQFSSRAGHSAGQKMTPSTSLAIAAGVTVSLMGIYGFLTFSTYGAFYTMVLGSASDGWATMLMTLPTAVLVLALAAKLAGPPRRQEESERAREPAPPSSWRTEVPG